MNHRYLWSTAFVLELLRTNRVSDAASFRYFLAIMTFDWLQFTLIATTPTPRIHPWSTAGAWATFGVTVLGLIYLYRANGGRAGEHFLNRYFPLSVTVGWKFVGATLVALWLIPVALNGRSQDTVGWTATFVVAFVNVVMFWRIGIHLAVLDRGTTS